jgi:hypothetical protein
MNVMCVLVTETSGYHTVLALTSVTGFPTLLVIQYESQDFRPYY